MPRNQIIKNLLEELRYNSTAMILFHQAMSTKLGLHPTDHKCLDLILKYQPLTAGRLSELSGLTTGAITGVLNRLEKIGYIQRIKDPLDRRRIFIHPDQKKAEENIAPLFQAFGQEMNQLFSHYNDQELQNTLDLIRRCNNILKKFTEKMKNNTVSKNRMIGVGD